MDITGHSVDANAPRRGLPSMVLMAMATGVIAGLGAWGFRMLIGLVHNVLFLGEFWFAYDANVHTPPSPWGMGVALGQRFRGSNHIRRPRQACRTKCG